jgi:hypothetical protein
VLQHVEVLPDAEAEVQADQLALAPMEVPREDLKVGVQTLQYDLGYRNLPVIRLRLDTADRDFARPLKVFGRNTATNSWRWVADGGIHRMGDQVRSAVDLGNATYRYLKIELYHYEQPPLTVTGVVAELEPVFLVVEAASEAARMPTSALRPSACRATTCSGAPPRRRSWPRPSWSWARASATPPAWPTACAPTAAGWAPWPWACSASSPSSCS